MKTPPSTTKEDFITREYTSENGDKFQVGYPKSAGYTEDNLDQLLDLMKTKGIISDSNDSVTVNWPVPSTHNPTKQDVQYIGISRAELSTGIGYDYKLDFWNTKGWKFYFKDGTGDIYSCTTVRNGHHFIQYGSNDPTIVEVSS